MFSEAWNLHRAFTRSVSFLTSLQCSFQTSTWTVTKWDTETHLEHFGTLEHGQRSDLSRHVSLQAIRVSRLHRAQWFQLFNDLNAEVPEALASHCNWLLLTVTDCYLSFRCWFSCCCYCDPPMSWCQWVFIVCVIVFFGLPHFMPTLLSATIHSACCPEQSQEPQNVGIVPKIKWHDLCSSHETLLAIYLSAKQQLRCSFTAQEYTLQVA